jgi:uncharacterized integral membrane protein (TIGR00698 family)
MSLQHATDRTMSYHNMRQLFPGIVLCIGVSAAAMFAERMEAFLFGGARIEALVLAILLGALVRTLRLLPGDQWSQGVSFSAKSLLEIAVLLLGASLSAQTVLAVGPNLLGGIAAVVLLAIASSYGIGRLLGLSHGMATLVACGNSICGNSAIAAVAPVIGADGKDVSASIAFTAVLGVIVVVGLPLLPSPLHFSSLQYGVLAGLTVYAVPQVLAATAPLGSVAVQMGTLVKLVRVLMLAPVVLVLSLVAQGQRTRSGEALKDIAAENRPSARRPSLLRLVPWYVLGFLVLAGLRSAHLVPDATLGPISAAARVLTLISMAALGLGTDLRAVARAGIRVTAVVALSLLVLGVISFVLIRSLPLA